MRRWLQLLRNTWIALGIAIISLGFSRKASIATGLQIDDLMYSGYFGSTKTFDTTSFYRHERLAAELHADGKYFEAISLHKTLLESVYQLNEIDDSNWTPPFLSYYFGAYLGHRAFAGTLLAAQDIGLIKQTNRCLPYEGDPNKQQLKIIFGNRKEVEIMESNFGFRFLEGPVNWHLSERLWMIKTNNGFMETQAFVDKTFQALHELGIESTLVLDPVYEEQAQEEMLKIGLPKGQEFVALHVRKKNWNPYDIRQAKIENYVDSVRDLIGQGVYVVQFGTDPQSPVVNDNRVLIVQGDQDIVRFLTPYILARCRFLINTSSGPTYLAALYGTPILQTNVVAFGKSCPVLSKNSISIPKKFIKRGRAMSLHDLLSSPQGYSYRHVNVLNKNGFDLIENTSGEILNATRDITILTQKENLERHFLSQVDLIRKQNKSPCNGEIAPSYLEMNQSWFLTL